MNKIFETPLYAYQRSEDQDALIAAFKSIGSEFQDIALAE